MTWMNYLNILFSCLVLSHQLAPLPCEWAAPCTQEQMWERGAGADGGEYGSTGTRCAKLIEQTDCFSHCKMHLGCHDLCMRKDLQIAFRLWLQGGVGGETLCLFYYVSLYHST